MAADIVRDKIMTKNPERKGKFFPDSSRFRHFSVGRTIKKTASGAVFPAFIVEGPEDVSIFPTHSAKNGLPCA